jgi:uncharacterized protein (TIGR03437 family)
VGAALPLLLNTLSTSVFTQDQSQPVHMMYVTHAATFSKSGLFAPGTICAAFGDFPGAPVLGAETYPLPTTLGGFRMTIGEMELPLFFVSPTQVNFLIPASVPVSNNLPELTLTYQDRTYVRFFDHFGTPVRANIQTVSNSPGLFTIDSSGTGVISGQIAVLQDGQAVYLPICTWQQVDGVNVCVPTPLPSDVPRYLIMYGTGLGEVNPGEVHCLLNNFTELPVFYAGPSPDFAGLDQYNMQLPDNISLQYQAGQMIPISIYVEKQLGFLNPRSQINTNFVFGAAPSSSSF